MITIDDFKEPLDLAEMRIYISGSITSEIKAGRDWKKKFLKYEEFLSVLFPNATFFNSAREVAGADMFPQNDSEMKELSLEDWQYKTVMTRDIKELIKCDAVAFTPDWSESQGAKCEMEIASCLKMKKIFLPQLEVK